MEMLRNDGTNVAAAPAEKPRPAWRGEWSSANKTNGVLRVVFPFIALAAILPFISPGVALLIGIVLALTIGNPYPLTTARMTTPLLQISVVGLGAGMNLVEVGHAGVHGFFYTVIGITLTVTIGLILGRLLGTQRDTSLLVTVGTAICGGSAIAAVAPVIRARSQDVSVALATVFFLNAVALIIFPPIGHRLGLGQMQFGIWSALAIHDTSSVVGATAKYGATALAVGTTVKLTRALWIVPLSIATAVWLKSKAKIQWPWFIALFCLAALLNTLLPNFNGAFAELSRLGRIGLTVTLFLIGTGLNKETLKRVGVRPLLQGLTLWIIVGVSTLGLILVNWIRL